jgi:hypothetical protein
VEEILSSVLNVHDMCYVTDKPLVPGPSHIDVETAFPNLEKNRFPDIDQIPAELSPAAGETLLSVIHKLTNSIWNKRIS